MRNNTEAGEKSSASLFVKTYKKYLIFLLKSSIIYCVYLINVMREIKWLNYLISKRIISGLPMMK